MILDAHNMLSDAQAVTADATSANVIDLSQGKNLGDGEPMAILLCVDVAADATTGDETYEFEVHTDDNAAMSSSTELVAKTIAAAALTAGSKHVIPIPPGAVFERYLALKYDVGGTTPTITASAYLVPMANIDKFKAYADGITIS